MKQKHYIAGLYYRLSQEDERQGESVSIDNQRTILRKYAEERGFEIHDEYIDDGVSGTTFQRPEVQRLLDDAKTGVINTIIVKDLSRFGRNYIEVGQYVDYVFPAFGIRFIAIQDNVDTENRDSGAMEMARGEHEQEDTRRLESESQRRRVPRQESHLRLYQRHGRKTDVHHRRRNGAYCPQDIRDVCFGDQSEKNIRDIKRGKCPLSRTVCF